MKKDSEKTLDLESDHALMRKVAAGDQWAFRQLVERHQHSVVGTVSKMLGDSADSEDIAQSVFIRIWNHAPNYKPENRFTTYLYTIVRNLVFNESRRRVRKPTFSHDAYENKDFLPHKESQPDALLLEQELQAAVHAAIEALPAKQRMAVILRRYENLSYEEIAQVMETSVPSLKSLLFRARTLLRESLAKYIDS